MKLIICSIVCLCNIACYAFNVAVLVGQNNTLNTPLVYVLQSNAETPTLIPTTDQGFLNAVVFSSDGAAILGGESFAGPPLAYRLPLGSETLIPITIPDQQSANILSIAIAPDGTAVLVGQDFITDHPIIYTLPRNATIANSNITVPFPETNSGAFTCVAIGPSGDAIIAGNDTSGLKPIPVVYRLPKGSTTAVSISNPNSHHGNINAVGVGIDNTAVIVGEDLDTQEPLIYRVRKSATTSQLIQNPNSNLGYLTAVDFPNNGVVAVLGGHDNHDGSFTTPLIHLLPGNASQAILVTTHMNHLGAFDSISIGANGVGIGAGRDSTTNTPLVFRHLNGPPNVTLMNNPNSHQGFIGMHCSATDADGTAILGGQDITAGSIPLIYRLPLSSNTCISIPIGDNPDQGQINAVDIFSFDGIRSHLRTSNNR